MNVTATALANDSKSVIDRVISRNETVDIRRHGKTVAQIRRKARISGAEFAKRLKEARFTTAESRQLKSVMDTANQAFRDVHRH